MGRRAHGPETLERERQVLELRKAGATFRAIGQQVGFNDSRAHAFYKRAMRGIIVDDVEDIRALETERLDAMLLVCWAKACEGDLGAVDRVLRVMERRARLLGLDAEGPVDQVAISSARAEAFLAGMRYLAEATQGLYAAAGVPVGLMDEAWNRRGPQLMAAALESSSRKLANGQP
jgi:hypothetical protein